MNDIPGSANQFGLGAQIFGGFSSPTSPPTETKKVDSEKNEDDEGDLSDVESDSGSEASLLTAMASVNVEESPWKSMNGI